MAHAITPDTHRVLAARNLPFKATAEEVYDLFARFGAVRQVRLGQVGESRGTAFVIFDDIFEAAAAKAALDGAKLHDRYITVRFHRADSLKG